MDQPFAIVPGVSFLELDRHSELLLKRRLSCAKKTFMLKEACCYFGHNLVMYERHTPTNYYNNTKLEGNDCS